MPSIDRRTFLGSVVAASLLSLAGCEGRSRDRSQDWSQFGFDAANTAANPAATGPTGSPSPAWVHLGGSYYRNSTQVALADRLYANAGYDGLYAVTPETGDVVWHDQTGYKSLTTALSDGVVLAGGYGFRRVSATGGADVLGDRVGYRDWQTALAAYPESPPTVAGGALYAGVGTAGRSRGGGRVVAVDLADGAVRWSTPVESSVWGAPAVADGVVYAAQRAATDPPATAALYALDAADGGVRWRRDLGADPRVDPVDAPVVGERLVYVSTGVGPLVAVDRRDGTPVWTLDPPGGVQASPALADGVLYVGDLDGTFHALDAATGDERWRARVATWYGGPMVGRDGVYAVTGDGTLVSWRRDGDERWRVSVDPPVRGSPVVANDRLFLGTGDGLLYALA